MTHDQHLAAAYELTYVHATGKDYQGESGEITSIIRRRHPGADSLLDVACGTGLHLAHLRHSFAHVEGVEIAGAMRLAATERLGPMTVHAADMRDFHLGRTFSAVTCLFSSIGYVQSVGELNQTLHCLAEHLEPGGVLLLEPWYTPDQWIPGTVHRSIAGDANRHLTRTCYTGQTGSHSTMTMHYVLGHSGSEISQWTEQHVMSLFTIEQYRDAIRHAGLDGIEELPGWYDQRPRITAVKGLPMNYSVGPVWNMLVCNGHYLSPQSTL